MRINSVNNIIQSKNANFKGLWGKASCNPDFNEVLGMKTVNNTYYYYPFSDEPQEEVDATEKSIDSAGIYSVDFTQEYRVEDCKVCTRLPFTKEVYEQYAKANETDVNADPEKYDRINIDVMDKYANSGYNSEHQRSAMNKIVDAYLRIWKKLNKRI